MMTTLKIFSLKPRIRQRYSSGIQIVLEVLALAVRQKKRRSPSGSGFIKYSAWAVHLTEIITLGGDSHRLQKRKLSLRKVF